MSKIKIVYGAPCSGKTTYIKNNKKANTLIYDFDEIMAAISGKEIHKFNDHLRYFVYTLREIFIDEMERNDEVDECIISTTFIKGNLEGLNAQLIKMKATKEECLKRLEVDTQRQNKENLKQIICNWFKEYGDE